MDEAKKLAVQSWLVKAERDLASADCLAAAPKPLLDTAIYHCQQAAEKALKGFLVYHDSRIHKTHDLGILIADSSAFTTKYAAFADAAERLTQYAMLFRYPGTQLEPDPTEYKQAFHDASEFIRITLALIPVEAHPGE